MKVTKETILNVFEGSIFVSFWDHYWCPFGIIKNVQNGSLFCLKVPTKMSAGCNALREVNVKKEMEMIEEARICRGQITIHKM